MLELSGIVGPGSEGSSDAELYVPASVRGARGGARQQLVDAARDARCSMRSSFGA